MKIDPSGDENSYVQLHSFSSPHKPVQPPVHSRVTSC